MSQVVSPPLSQEELNRQHDQVVRAEIEQFRVKAQEFLAGKIGEDDFRAYRLRFGCYGQRQPGVQMVRTKIPGGMMTADQMDRMADVADFVGGGKGHLTTRQNMQFHFVPLEKFADTMHMLHDVGLTSREACYNTVRNVTACPYAGLTRQEVFDVRPYSRLTAFAFLRKGLTDAMPRKFKICFDGCTHQDCTIAAIHDVGAKAVIRNGERGFKLVVGGGLGPLPLEARVLDEFLPVGQIVPRIEAVLRVFNEYGNRKNRNLARLKFVVRDRGFEWVKEQIDKEYADILANGGQIPVPSDVPEGFGGFTSTPLPLGNGSLLPVVNRSASGDENYDRFLASNVEEQKQTGYAMVTVHVRQGNLTSAQMRGLAKLARDAGDGCLRVTVEQNLVYGFVQLAFLPRMYAALQALDLADFGAREIQDVVTCPGTYSCNLGLTKAMNLGAAMHDVVRHYDDPSVRKLQINISGCPNACGQHWTAEIGFYGNARKIEGKEVPHYQMLLGGGYDEQGVMRFGLQIQSLPARNATVAIQRVLDHYIANHQGDETFRNYVLRYKVEFFRKELLADLVKPTDLSGDTLKDWGDDDNFSLQLGRGECAA